MKLVPMFLRVVVDEPHRRQAELRILDQFFRDFAARVARSRDQDATNLVSAIRVVASTFGGELASRENAE